MKLFLSMILSITFCDIAISATTMAPLYELCYGVNLYRCIKVSELPNQKIHYYDHSGEITRHNSEFKPPQSEHIKKNFSELVTLFQTATRSKGKRTLHGLPCDGTVQLKKYEGNKVTSSIIICPKHFTKAEQSQWKKWQKKMSF